MRSLQVKDFQRYVKQIDIFFLLKITEHLKVPSVVEDPTQSPSVSTKQYKYAGKDSAVPFKPTVVFVSLPSFFLKIICDTENILVGGSQTRELIKKKRRKRLQAAGFRLLPAGLRKMFFSPLLFYLPPFHFLRYVSSSRLWQWS